MKIIAYVLKMPGPLEDYGFDTDIGYPNLEYKFMYRGPQFKDLFENYGGTGGTSTNEDDTTITGKDILVDLRNLKLKNKEKFKDLSKKMDIIFDSEDYENLKDKEYKVILKILED